jgi:DNA repair exonuclease SbcCD nuclease subunit
MAKFLIFSDIHIHPHKKSQERLQDCLNVLDWVFQKAIENEVDAVLFGGDLLHDRQKIDSLTYMEVFNILEKYQNEKFQVYLLLGNHDLWFANNWRVSSVIPFKALKNFEVIDKTECKIINGTSWHFIPYTHDPVVELDKLKSNDIKNSYLLAHLAIDGAKLNSFGTTADVIVEHDGDMIIVDKNLFSKYKRAFFGHYHCPQKLSKTIEYIGSPLQLSFGEVNEDKHLIILDSKEDKISYIKNDFSPKHFYINSDEITEYSKKDLKNSFVCILSEDDEDELELKKKLSDFTSKSEVATIQVKKQSKKQDIHAVMDAKQLMVNEDKILEKYVEQVSPNLDKEKLLEIGNKIVGYKSNEED